jgi:hypothetical protein
MSKKPLGHRNYGSIPHLPGSRMGPADRHCHEGQAKIATVARRDRNDEIIVQEKLDGSNVGVARINDEIIALGRAGYRAVTSPWMQHRYFDAWVKQNWDRFWNVLGNDERLVGEWLMQAHGTRYNLEHEPFVLIDWMVGHHRAPLDDLMCLEAAGFTLPFLIHTGEPIEPRDAMEILGTYGRHGALDPVEGVVYRVERDKPTGVKGEKKRVVDYLVKYVRPDKADGIYLPDVASKIMQPYEGHVHPIIWNVTPEELLEKGGV